MRSQGLRGRRFRFAAVAATGWLAGVLILRAAAPQPAAGAEAPTPLREVRYGRDVRRILSDRCFQCHGADAAARQADLRLDERAAALADRGGRAAIVPGHPAASELWRRVSSDDPDERMPPAAAHKPALSRAEQDVVRRWIEQGAPYEPHWAFVAPQRPAVPEVQQPDWCRGEIDRFVLARLEAAGVAPSPAADRAALLRRVFLDLTGLPPTPEELAEFEADPAADAYERWVDRLLGQEPYRSRMAEHLASRWLDAARYGDTCGIHTDNGRQMWLWRDWVLAALRDDMPFDRFLTEQLAGDLLPDATVAQRVASGFNRNHVSTDEGGAIAEEYLVEYAVDRVNTTFSVFLGLTVGCARCHDHKFDPIRQEDYYGLISFFNSIDEPGLYSQTPDSNRAYEPFLDVPSQEQSAALDALRTRCDDARARLAGAAPDEERERDAYFRDVVDRAAVNWTTLAPTSAASSDPDVQLKIGADHSVTADGPIPDFEDYTFTFETDRRDQRLLLLEALATIGKGPGAGRAEHRNAVLTGLGLEVRPRSADAWERVPLVWAWADYAQQNGDFEPVNALVDGDKLGWAIDGNERAGSRRLLVLAERPFGFEGGTALRVTLQFRSEYSRHTFGRVRLRVSPLSAAGLELLPPALGRWYVAGPFRGDGKLSAFEQAFGPESAAAIDPQQTFDPASLRWTFQETLADERVATLGDAVGATYVGRMIWSPDAREIDVSLGSDDGFRLFVNGAEVASNEVNRGAEPDQDRARISLRPGANTLVLKIVNTGGPTGYYFRIAHAASVLVGSLVTALTPADARTEPQSHALTAAWRRRFSAAYRQAEQDLAAAEEQRRALEAQVPRAMVLRELKEPRPTFVLTRGQYDRPDRSRPVARSVPAALGRLDPAAPPNRLGLAQWMISAENPLVARVAVNRVWEGLFGVGLVRTSEDFGFQGEWPTHIELLDWLAVDFRESGWDVRRLLRQIVTSSTYRQSSRVRAELRETDPENRLLAYYPRRRLAAEQIRDLALYAAGLLVERFGGPSVKPYQPEALWQEVAMPASNTRVYARDRGDALWRRSVYTYWKRAAPPPSLQTFDAPTREACTIRRPVTNTPLQALVLWNDEQFVEAARGLAQRTLAAGDDDDARLSTMFLRCAGRAPDGDELAALRAALDGFRARFADDPDAAADLLRVGELPADASRSAPETAAWTLVASAVLNLHETLTQD